MIPRLRDRFNAQFSPDRHARFLATLAARIGAPIEFRPCETPVFLPADLLSEMRRASDEILAQLGAPGYLALSDRAIPEAFRAPGEGPHPTFIQVDFAVARGADGRLAPKLIELQGCASLYAFLLGGFGRRTHGYLRRRAAGGRRARRRRGRCRRSRR